jgi:hypothetical protein
MMEMVPEGDLLPPACPNPNPELAMLENILASPAHTSTDLSFRFPRDRILPQGFNLSLKDGPSAMPSAGPSFLKSPSNPFSATLLHIPADFSPSKVKGAKASSPPTTTHATKKKATKAAPVNTKSKTGTRTSTRAKAQASYAEAEDTADDES